MSEEQLLDVIHKVFQEMFNAQEDDTSREKYRPIIHEYLKLRNGNKEHNN
jgi:hypothetical protein